MSSAYKVGDEIKPEEVAQANLFRPQIKQGYHNRQADVGSNDAVSLMWLEQARRWPEVLEWTSKFSGSERSDAHRLTLVPEG